MHKVYWAVVKWSFMGNIQAFDEFVDDEHYSYMAAEKAAVDYLSNHPINAATICRVSNKYGWLPFRTIEWRFHNA